MNRYNLFFHRYTDVPGVEDANMSSESQLPENRKPSAWTVLKQMSKGGASSTPSYFSEKLVAIYVCVYCKFVMRRFHNMSIITVI